MAGLESYEGAATIEKVAALCRRRGFVYPSSDIYGGLGSSYDYGHYGVLLKQNVKAAWQRSLSCRSATTSSLLDSAIILNPQVWVASGHVGGFSDPLVDCRTCKLRFRADHLATSRPAARRPSKHPGETPDCDLTEARDVQPDVRDVDRPACATRRQPRLPAPRDRAGHLRQLQERHLVAARQAAVRDRADRQELPQRDHPRQLPLPRCASSSRWRWSSSSRPPRRERWYAYWIGERRAGTSTSACARATCACAPHDADELSHYSSGTSDLEYLFPIGWSELEGIANRGDFDLTRARRALGHEARVDRPRGALRPARDRAGRRRRPRRARVPRRRLRRGGGRAASRAPCCASIRGSRRSRWRCCRSSARTTGSSARRGRCTRSCGG